MKVTLSGKVALITGGTSGIGARIGELFAENGARVYLTGRNEIKGRGMAQAIRDKGLGGDFLHLDVRDEKEVNSVVAEIVDKAGGIDILIHSAGYGVKTVFTELTYREWLEQIEINLNGTFLVTQAVSKVMKEQGGGNMVLISSGSVITGTGGGAPYVAAKAGQVGLTRSIARALAPFGINVNVIGPRNIETPMLSGKYSPGEKEELIKMIPLGRLGSVDDIANLALFMVGVESSYITDQFFLVDGGRTFSG